MNTKNLMSRSVNYVNGFTIQDLIIDLVELSKEDLKQIFGGTRPPMAVDFTVQNLGVTKHDSLLKSL
jgi:hypothetical protein